MNFNVILYAILSLPIGLISFYGLVKNIKAHLKDFKDLLVFFFHPFSPRRMLILHKLGGEFSIYYDDQIKEIKGEKQSEVFCNSEDEFDHFIVHDNLSDYALKVSMFDARAPPSVDSPFGVAWRWIVGASFTIYLTYLSMIYGWFPDKKMEFDPYLAMFGTMVFFIVLTWYLINIARMRDETIEYIYLLPRGICKGLVEYIHAPEPLSNLSLPKFLSKMGKEIRVEVPKELKEFFETLKKEKKDNLVTALSLTKFFEAYAWRKTVAENLKDMLKLRKAGETVAQIKMESLQSKPTGTFVLVGVICFVAGFVLGNVIGFSPAPPQANNTTVNSTAVMTTAPTTVVPATPPPPPVNNTSNVPVHPVTPPPPPVTAVNTTLHPAIPPTPPLGGGKT